MADRGEGKDAACRSPIVVRPATTTCEHELDAGAELDLAADDAIGADARRSSASVAPGSTMAVGWMCGIGRLV